MLDDFSYLWYAFFMKFKKYLGVGVSAIEWYDNAICISLTEIISSLFFPEFNVAMRFTLYLSSFAIGYLGRPIGAFLFGFYSDKYSRIKSVYAAFAIMIFSTLAISFLPTYNTAGVLAPIGFVFFRFVQGIALGGNYGVSIFSVENAHKAERYFASSMICVGFMIGFLFGGLVSSALSYFCTREFLLGIGWRLALWSSFLMGLPVLAGILKVKSAMIEEEAQKTSKEKVTTSNTSNEKLSWEVVGKVSIILLLDMVPFYIFFMFLPNCKIIFLNQAPTLVWLELSIGIFIMMILTPFFGKVADAYGALKSLKIAALSLLGIAIFAPWNHWVWSIIIGVIMAMCYGSLYGIVAMIFPKNIRARASSVTLNTTGAVWGGLTPLIATFLYQKNVLLLGGFLGLISIIVFIGLASLKNYEHEL